MVFRKSYFYKLQNYWYCDLAFEYSDVDADIKSSIESIKNPYKGKIIVKKVNNLILTKDSKYPFECEIIETN